MRPSSPSLERRIPRVALALFLVAASVHAADVPLTVHLSEIRGPDLPGEPATGTLHLIPADGESPPIQRTVQVPSDVGVEAKIGDIFRVRLDVDGWWLPEEILTVGTEPTEATLQPWPTGSLTARVAPPQGESLPRDLTVRFRASPGPEVLPEDLEGDVVCPLDDDGALVDCEVPAGTLDVRLRSSGFQTHHRWELRLPQGSTVHLGTMQLQRGSTVVGWVESPGAKFRFEEVRVELRPQSAGVSALANPDNEALVLQSATPDRRGYFVLADLDPGLYELTVRHPEFAPSRIAPLRVLPNAETEIESVTLSPPVELSLRIEPAQHPKRTAWHVKLARESPMAGHWVEVRSETVSRETGRWTARDLEPGAYALEVSDGRGSTWYDEVVTLNAESPDLEIRLPILRVAGFVTLAEEPIRSTVYFGGKQAAERVVVDSNGEGRFYVFLPEREAWNIDVRNPEMSLYGHFEDVVVEPSPDDEPAELHLEIPDTRIRGEVVDTDGKTYPGAAVTAFAGREVWDTRAEEPDGVFELRGFPPGDVGLEAAYAAGGVRYSSESLDVVVDDGESLEDVQLVLHREKVLQGQVVNPQGRGVPGAQIIGWFEQGARAISSNVPRVTTDVNGVFELEIPGAVEGVVLTVLPPGFAVTQQRVAVRDPEPVLISVDVVGGSVVVSGGEDSEGQPRALRSSTVFLFGDRLLSPLILLQSWARSHGTSATLSRFVAPMLEPGTYTACVNPGDLSLRTTFPPPDASGRCATGTLPPYGELTLVLPDAGFEADPTPSTKGD